MNFLQLLDSWSNWTVELPSNWSTLIVIDCSIVMPSSLLLSGIRYIFCQRGTWLQFGPHRWTAKSARMGPWHGPIVLTQVHRTVYKFCHSNNGLMRTEGGGGAWAGTGSGSSKRTRSGRELQNADSIYYRGRQEIKVREVGGSESLVSPHLIWYTYTHEEETKTIMLRRDVWYK